MSRNNKRTVKTSHSEIFEYWKDKAITKGGNVVLDTDGDKDKISVVRDWTMPRCFACCDNLRIDFNNEKFNKEENDIPRMWDYPEIKRHLNKCHIKPHSAGGSDEARNLFLLCETCHIEAPDTGNPKNFFKWVYKRRHQEKSVNGFIMSELMNEFLENCKDKGKNPETMKPELAEPYQHGGGYAQSSIAMALADTCDDL